MPLPQGTRFVVRTFSSGKRVRLAFSKTGQMVEAKSLGPIIVKENHPMSLKRRKTHTRKR